MCACYTRCSGAVAVVTVRESYVYLSVCVHVVQDWNGVGACYACTSMCASYIVVS